MALFRREPKLELSSINLHNNVLQLTEDYLHKLINIGAKEKDSNEKI